MSIRRMTLGSGYRYLMASVARGDGAAKVADGLAAYYAETGTPPGRFLGRGLAGVADGRGVAAGTVVTEEHLFRMLGMLQDPVTGQPLGRLPGRDVAAPEGGTVRRTVAGFDLTFSAPKSVSVAWALADPVTQQAIYAAHGAALEFVISYAEDRVFASRTGKHGVVQEDVRGVVAAAFDHWESRAGDPQLHTHVTILNRVQTRDGRWRTLDSRGLFKATVELSTLYNTVLADLLTAELGFGWEPAVRRHSPTPKWEIAGVPERLRDEFSTRSRQINAAADQLAADFTATLGRRPTPDEMARLRQQATLSTRPVKEHHSLAELTRRWRAQAAPLIDTAPGAFVASLHNRVELTCAAAAEYSDDLLRDAAAVAVRVVAERRATFSRSNLTAEVLRQLAGVRFASPAERVAVTDRITDLALAQPDTLLITPPDLAITPAAFQRPDGTSRFRPVGHERYTTRALLDAETRLLDTGRDTTGPRLHTPLTERRPADERRVLSDEQRQALAAVAISGRVLDVLVGPAGTGKSTTMAGLRHAWEAQFGSGSVLGLAPSAAAADVLAGELGIACENTEKWLTEHHHHPHRLRQLDRLQSKRDRCSHPLPRRGVQQQIDALTLEINRWTLRPGQLLILDEASLAGTLTLDTITAHAKASGAKLLLVGDWAQLSAVTAGGGFHLLARDRDDVAELSEVHRFTETWEKAASTGLRLGWRAVLATYAEHGRISGGDRDTTLDELFQAWLADTDQGLQSVMIAADNDTVQDLNQRARAHHVTAGTVQPDGIPCASGSIAGVGDRIVTRRNDRSLTSGGRWVKNGDQFIVTATGPEGSCTVRPVRGRTGITLPASYVRENVELGYATNAHRAHGRTFDTAHAYLTDTTHRELLYVMATRGRTSNRLYVDTSHDPDHEPTEEQSPLDVLTRVLANEGAEQSATGTLHTSWDDATSIRQLWAEYDTIATAARTDRHVTLLLESGLADEQVESIRESPSYGPLCAALADADSRGLPLNTALPALISAREIDTADDLAAVVHHRVDGWLTTIALGQLRTDLIVGLFPSAADITDPEARQALEQRRALIEQRAQTLIDRAVEQRQPWILQVGTPPTDSEQQAEWRRHAETIAAYRDRWDIHDATPLGTATMTTEQETQLHAARRAATFLTAAHRSGEAKIDHHHLGAESERGLALFR